MSKPFDQIHRKVADALGMQVPEEEVEETNRVPVPATTEIAEVDNPDLPNVLQELVRLEHGQRQGEVLLERGLVAVQGLLSEIALTPPMYKGRVVESAAELFKAVADLSRHKVDSQVKIAELKLKMAAFSRNRSVGAQTFAGNTIIFNREELIRQFGDTPVKIDDE